MSDKFSLVPVVAGPPAKPATPSVSRTAYQSMKDGLEKTAKASKERAAEINKELKQEPERALKGQVLGNAAGHVAVRIGDDYAKKNPESFVAKSPKKATLLGTVLSEGVAYWGASKGNLEVMHGGMHSASHMAGVMTAQNLGRDSYLFQGDGATAPAAPTAPAPAPAPAPAAAAKPGPDKKGVGAPENPYIGETPEVEGPERRRARRRQALSSALAAQVATENPDAVNGSDALEDHINGVLDQTSELAGGPIEDAIYGDVGAVPLLFMGGQALANILRSLPGLKAMAENPEKVQQAAVTQGVTPGMDSLLTLSGYQLDGLTVEGKKKLTREERKLQKLERERLAVERKKNAKDSQELVKSGALISRLDSLEKLVRANATAVSQLSASMGNGTSAPTSTPAQTFDNGFDGELVFE